MICIRVFPSRFEAELARGLLEANGVSAIISTDSAGGLRVEMEFALGVRLLVNRNDAAEAAEILGG